jgi:hypothetical protein
MQGEARVSPEEIDKIIGMDDRDALIDQWAFDDRVMFGDQPLNPNHVTLTIRHLGWCLAIIDMAFETMEREKQVFVAAENGSRSGDALDAAYRVVAMRELLRQLLPIRERVLPYNVSDFDRNPPRRSVDATTA